LLLYLTDTKIPSVTVRFHFTFLLVASFFCCSAQTKIGTRKIIDVHLHARHFDSYGNPPYPNPVTGKSPSWKSDEDVVRETLSVLKKYNIVKAITSGSLDRISQFYQADPKRIIPSLDYPDPHNNPLPDTSTFVRLFKEGKFLVFGELGLEYEGTQLNDPKLDPYLKICERLKIPVALHTGLGAPNTPYMCCPKFRTSLGNPQLVEDVLNKYPRLKLQLMHMGYPFLAETKAILYVYPQVHADMSVVNWILPKKEFHNYLQALLDAGFGDRIMYGSDQMGWTDAIELSIKNVEDASFLSESQKQDLFYNNAARFYNIGGTGK
jgi:uncharacterized protein